MPPGCNGLMTVLDWLTNPWEPYKRGIMIGFDSSMDYAWIYRSILESVALTLKNNYDNMCHEMNHFAKHVIITGGGSNSDLFMQIFADVFNLSLIHILHPRGQRGVFICSRLTCQRKA